MIYFKKFEQDSLKSCFININFGFMKRHHIKYGALNAFLRSMHFYTVTLNNNKYGQNKYIVHVYKIIQ